MQAGEAGTNDILAGIFQDLDEAKLPAVAAMHERGPKCFDVGYYRSHNPDLHQAATATEEQLWAHFLHFGQFERRPFRWAPAATSPCMAACFAAPRRCHSQLRSAGNVLWWTCIYLVHMHLTGWD
jgi:hypothetical protein